MAPNATSHVSNSTQPGLSYACSLLGIFAWKQQYLTPNTFPMYVFTATVVALACPFTILLNALVILAMKRKRYLRKKKCNVLLVYLAGTDLLVGAVVQPLVITSHVLRILGMGPICLVEKIAATAMYIAGGASFFHLVIISGERYIGIKHALRYEAVVTTGRLTRAVAIAWAVPVITGSASVAFDLADEIVLRDQLLGMVMIFSVSSGLFVVSFCQGAVFLESRRHRKHIKAHQVSESSAKELLKGDKAATTTTIVVGAMCLCFAPLVAFYEVALNLKKFPSSLSIGVMYLIDVLVYCNSLLNPIIYCVRTQEFRRAISELLHLRGPEINADHIERRPEARRPRGQRKDDNVCISSPHETDHMVCSDPAASRSSRSRSLDLSKDSSHKPGTRRTNSDIGLREASASQGGQQHKTNHVVFSDPAASRSSRSRSLDLSKDSSHKPRTRRTNSVQKM